ncbi:ABC transporter permease [Vallitalea okinawensis]|uniref:ABC transporter permease n=1 Tax=Vallitalea okinawensis TaxID=2078660 RepID=UPI000CFAF15F|nr:ABC transporter permease subunit [Vallitalea okinawensis]
MVSEVAAKKTRGKSTGNNILNGIAGFGKELVKNWSLYLMAIPAMVLLILFKYFPMFGIIIAFKDYNFRDGILGSKWMDPLFENFAILVNSESAWQAIINTVSLNFLFIITSTLASLALAIMLNEVSGKTFKKLAQSITFLPFFMSWIVVGLFVSNILSYDNGIINKLLESLGREKIMFYMEPQYWTFILMLVNIWKGVGYGAVVYLAAITGIDKSFYEAARIDGATRWQEIRFITLQMLKPTVIILVLLAFGRIMNADFGMFYYVTSDVPMLYPTTDVIDTFIYRGLRQTGDIGMSSAAGFFQSIISFVFVIVCNKLANHFEEGS